MLGQLCLVSTSGDMSSRGMGNHNTIYLFPYEYKKQVDNFLKAELNFSLHTYNENWLKKGSSKIPCKRYSESYYVLKDLNDASLYGKNIPECKLVVLETFEQRISKDNNGVIIWSQSAKINPSNEEVLCNQGRPIYRNVVLSFDMDKADVYIKHDGTSPKNEDPFVSGTPDGLMG